MPDSQDMAEAVQKKTLPARLHFGFWRRDPLDEARKRRSMTVEQQRQALIQRWINMALALTALALFLHNYAILILPVFLLVTFGVAEWWNGRVLNDVTYARAITPTRAFPGEAIQIDIQVENAKILPVPWLRIEDAWPPEAPATEASAAAAPRTSIADSLINVYSLRWYERVHRHYTVEAKQRGIFALGPTRMRAGDIFGLFHSEQALKPRDYLVIYPRVRPLEDLGLSTKELFGKTRARYQWMQDPSRTMGARDLRPGDSFRHIHWPATARRQTLQTRVYEPTATLTAVICLDVATLPKAWQGILPDLLEDVIVCAASLAAYAAENRYAVGLIANGARPLSERSIKVMPGRAPDQLMRILESLAALTGFVTASMDKFLFSESPSLPWGATLVVVTSVTTPALLSTLEQLSNAGRRIVLISLAACPPPHLPGILAHHLPSPHAPRMAMDEA